jgi:UDP-glucose 4-epimerase
MNRVLVTGASGFIGSHVTRRLLAEGREVHVLLRPDSAPSRLEDLGEIRRWTGDLHDRAALEVCLKGARPDRIIHCAGVSRARHMPGWAPIREAYRVNVDGFINLVEAACASGAPIRRLVRLGGLEEYGGGPSPFVETQREMPRSAYSASQVAGTHLLEALQPTLPFEAVTLRPTLIYGSGQSTDFMIPALIEALLAEKPFPLSEGRQRRDMLHIDDLVTAILAASTADKAGGEVINIASGKAPMVRTIALTIGRMMGRPHLLRLGELPDRPNDIVDLRGDASKAERLLAWRPTISLVRGLAQTIEWHRSRISAGCAA